MSALEPMGGGLLYERFADWRTCHVEQHRASRDLVADCLVELDWRLELLPQAEEPSEVSLRANLSRLVDESAQHIEGEDALFEHLGELGLGWALAKRTQALERLFVARVRLGGIVRAVAWRRAVLTELREACLVLQACQAAVAEIEEVVLFRGLSATYLAGLPVVVAAVHGVDLRENAAMPDDDMPFDTDTEIEIELGLEGV